jgi:hypothetical protein
MNILGWYQFKFISTIRHSSMCSTFLLTAESFPLSLYQFCFDVQHNRWQQIGLGFEFVYNKINYHIPLHCYLLIIAKMKLLHFLTHLLRMINLKRNVVILQLHPHPLYPMQCRILTKIYYHVYLHHFSLFTIVIEISKQL